MEPNSGELLGGFAIFLIVLFAIIFGILLLVAAIVVPLVIIGVQRGKREKFVDANSKAIAKVKAINMKYKMAKIKQYNLVNSYDNEDFYNNISCKDYLIYELQYLQHEVLATLYSVDKNRETYKEYCEEIKNAHIKYGQFSGDYSSFNYEKLVKYERERVKAILYKPQNPYSISVKLRRTNINDDFKESKQCSFSEKTILDIINKLKQKRGYYYLNDDIWNAICRVERGKVSNKIRFAIFNRDGNRCRMCGSTHNLEVDHIYPIAKGGKSTYDNLQTLCHRCNQKKGAKVY